MLIAAIAAFLPVLAVDFVLDSYVRARERVVLEQAADGVAAQVQATAYEGIAGLRRILAESPSLCTPSFIANVHRQIEQSLYLRQVLVENSDGVQYCDALGKDVKYTALSKPITIPQPYRDHRGGSVCRSADAGAEGDAVVRQRARVSAFVPVLASCRWDSLIGALQADGDGAGGADRRRRDRHRGRSAGL